MNAGQVVGDQLSAVSQSCGDALANAHCLHCGYSLCGLPENRCPECGRAFDIWMIATAAPVDKLGTKRGTGCKVALHALP